MRTGGRGDAGGPQGLRDGMVGGCAVTVLVYGLAESVKLGHATALWLSGGSVLVLVVAFGPWTGLGRAARRRIGSGMNRALYDGELQALALLCANAAGALDSLLAPGFDALWRKPTILTEHRRNKRLIAAYHREHGPLVQSAVGRARLTLSVPPNIVRFAEDPRSVADLQYLRDWLRRIADQREPV